MDRINVLVTGIGGPTAQGILRGLKGEEHTYLVGTDRRTLTSGNLFCDTFYQTPPYRELEAYKSTIKEIVEKENIHAIFPTLHDEIEIYRDFRHELDCEVALPYSNHFEVLNDKQKTYEFLEERGLGHYVPKYFGFNSSSELLQLKQSHFAKDEYVCVKKVTGNGSLGFAILTNRDNFLKAIKSGKSKIYNIDDYCAIDSSDRRIIMDYLDGREYSVDIFLHRGEVVTAVPRERSQVSNGIVLDGTVVKKQDLIEASISISERLADSGFINLQFIETDDGFKLTDVNARFGGSHVMSLGAGVNFPYLFLQYNILGEQPKVEPNWNTRMIRYREHFFVDQK
ncbi:ATP-grasp domain-containing protein [Virgibacillus xinjiangensis]|uniref:ATP-grasp domain-containing protein n=1 Tax=Virgibacillus xinjiangensis TaxID=393090 RepID=A0ABV7CUT3_9BACI